MLHFPLKEFTRKQHILQGIGIILHEFRLYDIILYDIYIANKQIK